ncbi:MAG TPA: porphobilinogen synthase [Polyangiales bacterium]|nr:porphobilinogen synthase [Polyangiales bacterium]
MTFPIERPRRLRRTETLRSMVRETTLSPKNFVLPLFAVPGKGVRNPVGSMPGVFQLSVDELVKEAKLAHKHGVPAVILFGLPDKKDALGSGGWDAHGPVAQAVRALKDTVPELCVITDVCMCEYTDHGHCGKLVQRRGQTVVDNDATLELLAKEALCHAEAGADIVAPSDMMDGRIAKIREALDTSGYSDVALLSYAAKFASGFYGPFREAADSAPAEGDRRGYQMDPANAREAMREVHLDIAEGADMVMVKPALSYLDVITRVRAEVNVPVSAYNVSGEYAMVKAAGKMGWIDEQRVMMEVLLSIKRAGADVIITYHAIEAAQVLGA